MGTSLTSNQRVQFIDVAKGVSMILIILCHNPLHPVIYHWLYSFHVPLFFIVSGYFTHFTTFRSLELKVWKQLVLPLIVTHLLFLIFFLIDYYFTETPLKPYPFNQVVVGELLALQPMELPNVWFLVALFWGKLWFFLTIKVSNKYYLALGLGLFVTAIFISHQLSVSRVPLHFVQGMAVTVFLQIGYWMKQIGIFEKRLTAETICILAVSLLFAGNMPINFWAMHFPNHVFHVVTITLITLSIIFACRKLLNYSNRKAIKVIIFVFLFYGRYSLVILCFHSLEMGLQLSRHLNFLPDNMLGPFKVLLLALVPFVIHFVPGLRKVYNVRWMDMVKGNDNSKKQVSKLFN